MTVGGLLERAEWAVWASGDGRKKLDENKRALAVRLYREKKQTVGEICGMVGISKPTLYQYAREAGR